MLGRPFLTLSTMALLFSGLIEMSQAAEFGTAEEAKAMLDKAVVAVRQDESTCQFSSNGGFKERDLYVLCANASDGIITAS
jgi:hypothetical protein